MIYIMLCNMTQNTRDRQVEMSNLIEYATFNAGDQENRVLSYYATLGRYDMIINAEATSVLNAAHLSVALSNMTGMDIETLPTMNMRSLEERMPVPVENPEPSMVAPVVLDTPVDPQQIPLMQGRPY